jgi:hypothetical protein
MGFGFTHFFYGNPPSCAADQSASSQIRPLSHLDSFKKTILQVN